MPHDKDHVLADVHQGGAADVERAIDAAGEAWHDWSRLPGRSVPRFSPPRRRAPRRPLARHDERGHDARPVKDRAPGRDRRGLRARRLPPLQRRVRDADLREGQPDLLARRLEPDGVPAARGLRLRCHAVQLHGDRAGNLPSSAALMGNTVIWKPRRRHGFRLLRHALFRGGPTSGRHQPRLRLGLRDREGSPRERAPGGDPLHRIDARLPGHVEDRRLEHRRVPELPGDRRRDRGKDFNVAHRSADPAAVAAAIAAPSSTRARSARLHRVSTCRRTFSPRSASGSRPTSAPSGWATSPTSRTSWAPSSTQAPSRRRRRRSRRPRTTRRPAPSWAEARTSAWGTSSSRR